MPYESPPFGSQILLGRLIKEIRPLNKPIRCIVLGEDQFRRFRTARLTNMDLENALVDLAKELGIDGYDFFFTSAQPVSNLDAIDPDDWERIDDRKFSIALEGETYIIDEEKTKKKCEYFLTDPSKIEMRYPEKEWWW